MQQLQPPTWSRGGREWEGAAWQSEMLLCIEKKEKKKKEKKGDLRAHGTQDF